MLYDWVTDIREFGFVVAMLRHAINEQVIAPDRPTNLKRCDLASIFVELVGVVSGARCVFGPVWAVVAARQAERPIVRTRFGDALMTPPVARPNSA